jgi:chorismate mutase
LHVTIMTEFAFVEIRKVVGFPSLRLAASFALVAGLLSGCSSLPAAQDDAFVPLVRHMADRVMTADQVALSKWDSGRPVHDPQREAQVIANVVAAAPAYGLAAKDVEDLFTDQMEASKQVQYARLDAWKRQGGAPAWERQSLSDEIRPRLDRLQVEIMEDLRHLAPARKAADCPVRLADAVERVARREAFDAVHRAALDRAVARVCIAD